MLLNSPTEGKIVNLLNIRLKKEEIGRVLEENLFVVRIFFKDTFFIYSANLIISKN